jgi:hypothetical protein
MRRWRSTFVLVGCILGVLTGLGVSAAACAQEAETGARLVVERSGDRLAVQALYAATVPDSTGWTHELRVERTGASTARTRQGGVIPRSHTPADTLSTIHLSVQPGDRVSLHLLIRRGPRVIDSARYDAVVSPSE